MDLLNTWWVWLLGAFGLIAAVVTGIKNFTTLWNLCRQHTNSVLLKIRLYKDLPLLIKRNAELTKENLLLKEENRVLIEKLYGREKWELHTTVCGGVVYRDKAEYQATGKAIYACPDCLHKDVTTFLKPERQGFYLKCHEHGSCPSDISRPLQRGRGVVSRGITL